jgi:hypothetical protein
VGDLAAQGDQGPYLNKWINRYVSHTRWLHTILDEGTVQADPPYALNVEWRTS